MCVLCCKSPNTHKHTVLLVLGVPNLKNTPTHMFFCVDIFGFGRVEVVVMLSEQAGEQRMHQTLPKPKNYKYVCLCVFLRFGLPQTNKTICLCVFLFFRMS